VDGTTGLNASDAIMLLSRQEDGSWSYGRYVDLQAVVTISSLQGTLKLADL
jgi:hypothetical protein